MLVDTDCSSSMKQDFFLTVFYDIRNQKENASGERSCLRNILAGKAPKVKPRSGGNSQAKGP